MVKGKVIANRSGYNGGEQEPCTHRGLDPPDDLACCEALAAQIAHLSAQIATLAEAVAAVAGGTPADLARRVVTRPCCLADGTVAIAYDFIPAGASSVAEISTIYRPLPAAEGDCLCSI